MDKTGIIGVDPGKRSFLLHGAREDRPAAFRRKASRNRFLEEMSKRGPCTETTEACGARHWGRELRSTGFKVRLVPLAHVKPFVKRQQKNNAADAKAVCETASRTGMRFVAVKSTERRGADDP